MSPRGSYELALDVDAIVEILARIVCLPSDLDSDEKRTIIRLSLFKWRRYETTNLQTFQTAIRTKVGHFYKSAMEPYRIIFFMNASRQSFARHPTFSILDHTFKIQSHNDIQNRFPMREFNSEVQLGGLIPEQINLSDFIPILIEEEWCDSREAVDKSTSAYNFYRLLLNFPLTYRSVSFQFGGRQRPLAQILPSPVYGVFDANDELIGPYYEEEIFLEYQFPRIDESRITNANNLLTLLNNVSDNKLRDLLTSIFLKYGEAIDTVHWPSAFLTLWQCLELASLGDRKVASTQSIWI